MTKAEERLTRHHYWKTLVDEQEESGLSQAEFCRQQNLVASQFNYYRNLFKKFHDEIKSNTFQPIHFTSSEDTSLLEIKIIFPNGLKCIFPSHIAPKQIKHLVEVMLSC